MAQTLASIDVEDSPVLKRLVEEIRESAAPVVLRQGGEVVAVVLPPSWVADAEPRRQVSEAERRAFLSTAGGWEGLIDVDEFLEEIYESRRRPPRPPVDLG